jgi:hypothetical protein
VKLFRTLILIELLLLHRRALANIWLLRRYRSDTLRVISYTRYLVSFDSFIKVAIAHVVLLLRIGKYRITIVIHKVSFIRALFFEHLFILNLIVVVGMVCMISLSAKSVGWLNILRGYLILETG